MLDFTNNSFYDTLSPRESDIKTAKETLEHIQKHAKLDTYNVRVFNMSLKEDVKDYTEIMKELFDGVLAKTHVIWAKERTLVNGDWKIYLEWSVYKLVED